MCEQGFLEPLKCFLRDLLQPKGCKPLEWTTILLRGIHVLNYIGVKVHTAFVPPLNPLSFPYTANSLYLAGLVHVIADMGSVNVERVAE